MHALQPEDSFTFNPDTKLSIIPFGGCGEFGMNMTAYISNGELYIVDCGLMFPDQLKLGVDAIIPELEPWFEKFGRPKSYIITHGHEDHIGALPLIQDKWPAPIYATQWTVALIKNRFERYGLELPDIRTVRPYDQIQVGSLSATYIPVNHSIPHTCSLLIEAGGKRVFHTGDFKYDKDNQYEPLTDLKRISSMVGNGVDTVLVDSTNATTEGHSKSEASVVEPLRRTFKKIKGTIYLTTFSSNLWRLLTVVKLADELKRRVVILGAGMHKTIQVARQLNLLDGISDGMFINEEDCRSTPRHKLLVLITGCQGEPRSALGRLCRDEVSNLKLTKDDGVIFSSRIIPGSERSVYHLSAICAQKKVQVVTSRSEPGIHVSGHAHQEDLIELIGATSPKYFVPVHGTFTQLMANREVAMGQGIPLDRCLVPEDGGIFQMDEAGTLEQTHKFEIDWQFVDAYSKQILDGRTLKQRLKIGELGLAVLSGVFDFTKLDWQSQPTIDLRGLLAPPSTYWQAEAAEAVRSNLSRTIKKGHVAPEELADSARLALRKFLETFLNKKVIVVAHVHPV